MTDPVGVAQDPRRVLMMGDEPDTVAELMRLSDDYAWCATKSGGIGHRLVSQYRAALEAALRAALEAQ